MQSRYTHRLCCLRSLQHTRGLAQRCTDDGSVHAMLSMGSASWAWTTSLEGCSEHQQAQQSQTQLSGESWPIRCRQLSSGKQTCWPVCLSHCAAADEELVRADMERLERSAQQPESRQQPQERLVFSRRVRSVLRAFAQLPCQPACDTLPPGRRQSWRGGPRTAWCAEQGVTASWPSPARLGRVSQLVRRAGSHSRLLLHTGLPRVVPGRRGSEEQWQQQRAPLTSCLQALTYSS